MVQTAQYFPTSAHPSWCRRRFNATRVKESQYAEAMTYPTFRKTALTHRFSTADPPCVFFLNSVASLWIRRVVRRAPGRFHSLLTELSLILSRSNINNSESKQWEESFLSGAFWCGFGSDNHRKRVTTKNRVIRLRNQSIPWKRSFLGRVSLITGDPSRRILRFLSGGDGTLFGAVRPARFHTTFPPFPPSRPIYQSNQLVNHNFYLGFNGDQKNIL